MFCSFHTRFFFSLFSFIQIIYSPRPPWELRSPRIIWQLAKFKKDETNPLVFRTMFSEIVNRLNGVVCVYTDGSIINGSTGCSFVSDSVRRSFRLPNESSIFTAELKAIELSLTHVFNLPENI